MKIIKSADITVVPHSDFDWDAFVEKFDWPAFYRDCHNAIYVYRDDLGDEDWGIGVKQHRYRIISLGLLLTVEDMQALEARCGAFGFHEDWSRLAFKLAGNLLFVVDDGDGSCDAIVRIEKVGAQYCAIEYLHDTDNSFHADEEPYYHARFVADWLSGLLPDKRFSEENLDEGFMWREPCDPVYT